MGQLQEFLDRLVDSVTGAFKFEVDPDLNERDNVEKVISETALVAGLIGCLQPFPVADLIFLAPLHVKMTLQIGLIKGHEVSQERALDMVKEIAGAAGVTLAAQGLISAIGKISPFTRALLSFPITYAATFALGRVAEYYFDCMNSGASPAPEVMKDLFAEQFKVGKKRGASFDMDEMKRRAEELRERMSSRDPSLVTSTRLEPTTRPLAGSTAQPTPPDPDRKIKITLKPRSEDPDAAGNDTPAGTPMAKTIGPLGAADSELEIGFRKAEKTLGEADPEPAVSFEELLPGVEANPPKDAPKDEQGALIDQLERLASLRESGALTDEEFQAAKQKLLSDL